jgi:integrase
MAGLWLVRRFYPLTANETLSRFFGIAPLGPTAYLIPGRLEDIIALIQILALGPTLEQFETIVESIRAQAFNRSADESADFAEFLGLAGVGQAEASSLKYGDIDWALGRLNFRRRKTGALFYVPIYPHLRPLLERRLNNTLSVSPEMPVFTIKDAKKALAAACCRLGYPPFSQRNMRQCLIMRLWKAGIDKKLIAKWQGHQDGGQLILDTYTEVSVAMTQNMSSNRLPD